MFKFWISNIVSVSAGLPQVGVKVVDAISSTVLYNHVLNNVNQTAIPTWQQQATLFNVLSSTLVNFQIYSNGAGGGGNDYAVDDIFVGLASVNTIMSTTTLNNLTIIDTIPSGTTFIPNSLKVDGVAQSGANPNPIVNNATEIYSFVIDSTTTPNTIGHGSSYTNNVNTQVSNANLGGIVKNVDKTFASCKEILTYTISIPNTGNITATNVVLSDTVPSGTVLVANSILVNGAVSSAISPISIPLGSIAPGTTTTVSFKVQVQC